MEKIDFLPERIRNQRARGKRLVRQAYLLGLCIAAMAVLAYDRQARISNAQGELVLLTGRSANVQRQLAMLGMLESEQAELYLKKRINDHLGSRVKTLVVLAELERLMPEGIALTNLHVETMDVSTPIFPVGTRNASARAAAAPAPEADPKTPQNVVKRRRVVITGLAPTDVDVANFIGQLASSKLFEEVTMGYAKNVVFRGRSAREFQTSCYVVR